MRWLAALLIGAVSNLDNLGVGLALGIRGTRIGAVANLIVAAVTMVTTAAAVTCGRIFSKLLPSPLMGWLGPLIIIAIGIGTVLTSTQPRGRPDRRRAPWEAWICPTDVAGAVSWRGAIVFGVALSVNNLGMGVGAGVSGIPGSATTVSAGLFSLLCVGGGSHLGRVFGRLVDRDYAPLIAGMLLFAVGAAMLPGVR